MRKRAAPSIKDKQIIIPHLDKGEKGTNLAQEFGISKQQISDILKNKDRIVVGDLTESESVCSDEEDDREDEKLVSTKEPVQCFKNCLSWMESQNDIDLVQLMQLRGMMDFTM